MGVISESFVLTDRFSAAFARFLSYGDSTAKEMERVDAATGAAAGGASDAAAATGYWTEAVGSYNKSALEAVYSTEELVQMGYKSADALSGAGQAADEMAESMNGVESSTEKAAAEQRKHEAEVKKTDDYAKRLLKTVMRIVSVAAAFSLAKGVVGLSDEMTQTKARIDLMNDGLQTTGRYMGMIYASAQRSRTPYLALADTVAKLGQRAGDAFGSSAEVLQFAENLNKQFVIAGTSQQEMASANLQLTQAMGAGVLRGQDLKSVFEAAPNVIQTIADYLDVPIGKIREMAETGLITADVVKNAMLNATDAIDEKFAQMPMTWGQAWASMKNAAVYASNEVLDKINEILNSDTGKTILNGVIGSFEVLADVASGAIDLLASGADFVAENWDYIYPVLIGVGAALALMGAVGLASGLAAAAGWIAAAWPIVLIGALVAALILGLTQAGVTFEQIGESVGTVIGGIYAVGYNTVADLWNLFAVFAEFFANVFNDPAVAVAHLFFGLFDVILGEVETVANAIDAVLKTNMSGAVSGFRKQLSAWVDDTFGENAVKIERMAKLDTADTAAKGGEIGADLGKKMDNMNFSLDDITGKLGGLGATGTGGGLGDIGNVGKVGSLGKIDQDVNIADENIKLLRDLSERQYVALVNLTVPQTNATINQNVSGGKGSDLDAMAAAMTKLLAQQHASNSNLAPT